ncbi:MAG: Maf family protein [Planctomycetes bacterium]|nr:Maf family protein [Planctomycetota bacterium]
MESSTSTNIAADRRVLLASRSPRRRELLSEAGVAHFAEHPGFDDAVLEPGEVGPEQWVASLAYLKAWAKSRESDAPVVIGADTACVMDGRLIGTPRHAAEAEGMIRGFMGRGHEVVTGVAIISRADGVEKRSMFSEWATVRVGMLTEEQIAGYVASKAWEGKAGAYNLRERIDAGWPIEFTGDPTTIMGLPMRALMRRLSTML